MLAVGLSWCVEVILNALAHELTELVFKVAGLICHCRCIYDPRDCHDLERNSRGTAPHQLPSNRPFIVRILVQLLRRWQPDSAGYVLAEHIGVHRLAMPIPGDFPLFSSP